MHHESHRRERNSNAEPLKGIQPLSKTCQNCRYAPFNETMACHTLSCVSHPSPPQASTGQPVECCLSQQRNYCPAQAGLRMLIVPKILFEGTQELIPPTHCTSPWLSAARYHASIFKKNKRAFLPREQC